MAKNQSLPARLQEKDSWGEDDLTMYGYHEKPTAWWPRPSFSNPCFTNDIVWAFLRASPTPLRFVTNRVLTERNCLRIHRNFLVSELLFPLKQFIVPLCWLYCFTYQVRKMILIMSIVNCSLIQTCTAKCMELVVYSNLQ